MCMFKSLVCLWVVCRAFNLLIFKSLQILVKTSLIKLEPWSVNIVCGFPNFRTTSINALATVPASCCSIGMANVYLESSSSNVTTYLFPSNVWPWTDNVKSAFLPNHFGCGCDFHRHLSFVWFCSFGRSRIVVCILLIPVSYLAMC
jgi:hypothetical protein